MSTRVKGDIQRNFLSPGVRRRFAGTSPITLRLQATSLLTISAQPSGKLRRGKAIQLQFHRIHTSFHSQFGFSFSSSFSLSSSQNLLSLSLYLYQYASRYSAILPFPYIARPERLALVSGSRSSMAESGSDPLGFRLGKVQLSLLSFIFELRIFSVSRINLILFLNDFSH